MQTRLILRRLWLLPSLFYLLLLLLLLPAAVQAQFTFKTNNYTITITGYTGPGGAVTIPSSTNGYPVTVIGNLAFFGKSSLTSITIPTSIISIGSYAFYDCDGLISVTIPNSVVTIGDWAFSNCNSLSAVTIGNSVTNIGDAVFYSCTSLAKVTIPNGVTSIGLNTFAQCFSLATVTIPSSVGFIFDYAFESCGSLAGVYFHGNAPTLIGWDVFSGASNAVVYYLPATIGWTPQVQTTNASFGVRTNQFGFDITGTQGSGIVVEACTNLAIPAWMPVATNTITGGSAYFSDNEWTNHPARFYRLSRLTYGGRPTALWKPEILSRDASFGLRNNRFEFDIAWASGMTVVVEACTNLANPVWIPLQTNILTGNTFYFSDRQWTNHPARFYRIRWP